jgi:hypothetical protein
MGMMMQMLIVWAIVGFAAWHVGKRLYAMLRGLTSAKASCATACGNCAFSANEGESSTFIPLGTITIQH